MPQKTPYEQLTDTQESKLFLAIANFVDAMPDSKSPEPIRELTKKLVNLFGYKASVAVIKRLPKIT